MDWIGFVRRSAYIGVLAAGVTAVAAATPGRASIISDTPTLPLLNVPYAVTSWNCFPGLGICVTGAVQFTSPSSSSFDVSGQHITTGALFSGTVTDLLGNGSTPITLSGTVEQDVLGRSSATETGSWTTNLVSFSFSGSVLGETVNATSDPGQPSTGTTSITEIGPNQFRINSFFDVFTELSLDGPITLTTTLGPIRVEAVPEPSSIAALATGLLIVLAVFRRRGAASPDTSRA